MTAFLGEVHPLAAEFPMIGADELADLAASIADNGQYDPITLSPDGVLLDGRNRLVACEIAGVEPTFETYDGDPVAFIVGKNATRRQLSSGQRAMAIAMGMWERRLWDEAEDAWKYGAVTDDLDPDTYPGQDRKPIRFEYIKMAGRILSRDRHAAREVLTGPRTLQATYKAILKADADAAERAAQFAELQQHAADLHRLILDESEPMTLPEAWKAYRERIKDERLAQQEALAAWSEAVDGLTAALAYLSNGHAIPDAIPPHRPDAAEFTKRLKALNTAWRKATA